MAIIDKPDIDDTQRPTGTDVIVYEEGRDSEQEDRIMDPLAAYIEEKFTASKTKRLSDENRWITSYRNYRGIFDESLRFTDTEVSKVFIKVTKTKVLAAYAQIVDVLFSGSKFPISIEASKDIGEGTIASAVHFDEMDEQLPPPPQSTSAVAARPELLGPLKSGLSAISDALKLGVGKTPTAVTWEPAKEAAKKMEKLIHDQLEEADASTHLRKLAFEMSLFGTGIFKGPFSTTKEYPRWTEDGYEPVFKTIPFSKSVSIWNFYPDAEATSEEDMDHCIERHRMTRSQLRKLKRQPHFRSDSIDAAIELGPNYQIESWESSLETNDSQSTPHSNRFEVLEFWGMVDKTELNELHLDQINVPKEELDKMETLQVNAWTCNGRLLRLVINPYTPMRIPYNIVPYEINPYSVFGIGIAENMEDTQLLMNGFIRLMIDNSALSSNVMLEVDETFLQEGQDMKLFPGKIFRRIGGQPGQMIHAINIPNQTNEILQMFELSRRLADESTSMPSYSHGGTGVNSVGRTASGMSMLMSAASQNIKSIVRNIDDYLLMPLGKNYFAFNMQYNYDKDIVGDLSVVAKGTDSLMRNEVRSQRLLQFMQITANPMAQPFVKMDYLLRELALSLDLDDDKLLNDPREAKIQAKMLKDFQVQSGMQLPQTTQQAQGVSTSDPTGTGGGNVMPGNSPEPDAAGFTGSGGGDNGGQQTKGNTNG